MVFGIREESCSGRSTVLNIGEKQVGVFAKGS